MPTIAVQDVTPGSKGSGAAVQGLLTMEVTMRPGGGGGGLSIWGACKDLPEEVSLYQALKDEQGRTTGRTLQAQASVQAPR